MDYNKKSRWEMLNPITTSTEKKGKDKEVSPKTETCTYPDGSKYVGEYKDGKMHGKGIYTNPDGQNNRTINGFIKKKSRYCLYLIIISTVVLVGVYLGIYYTTIMREYNRYFQKKSISDILPDITWEKTYGGSDSDWATSLIKTTDGGYALAGGGSTPKLPAKEISGLSSWMSDEQGNFIASRG